MAVFYSTIGSLTLKVEYNYSSQHINENTSLVSYSVSLETAYGHWNKQNISQLTINIDGRQIYTGIHNFDLRGVNSFVLKKGTYTVNHNNDGTKLSDIYVTFNTDTTRIMNFSVRGNLSLPKIPRASTLGDVTGVLGKQMTLSIQSSSNSFVHNLEYKFGEIEGTIARGIATNVQWTPSIELANQIPNALSGKGLIWVNTYQNSKLVGTKQVNLVLSVPDSMVPTFNNITLIDSHSKANTLLPENIFIKGISNIKATVTDAIGVYGSKINSYRIEILNKVSNMTTTNGGTLGLMDYTGTHKLKATITDSRGRTASKIIDIVVLDYFSPVFSFRAERSKTDVKQIDTYRHIRIAPLMVNGVQRNHIQVSFKYKLSTESTYKDDINSTVNNIIEQVGFHQRLINSLRADKAYTLVMTVSDAFSTASSEILLNSEKVVMSYAKEGIGIGKVWEHGSIDSAEAIYAFDKQIQHHKLTENNGSIKESNKSINDIRETGFYFVKKDNPANSPFYGLLSVFHTGGKEAMQNYQTYDGARQFSRCSNYSTGEWSNWIELSTSVKKPWISSGVSNIFYKLDGNTMHVRGYVKSTSSGVVKIGAVPSQYVPQNLMFVVAEWNSFGDRNVHLQVDGTGTMSLLNVLSNMEYSFNISWGI
ncbi:MULTISPECIES: DUF859 family phage minor structural protein [unclassified Granulicatella]|uniref:DUF859 family phage minor structural protein n=1 Tax=unclassified Granulicatella TaxID=2630493 RepID=UPI0010745BAE|nr:MULTISPECIES: DUF859 family phage minor structural protein [unclassified Granulicatella]MBF0779801.1 hypothetical protein [Granulicatella sp. 19428wC4_WM01]TFU96203.1 hypothetical protein E4T68_01715 [Granulicatella sp. WM01]